MRWTVDRDGGVLVVNDVEIPHDQGYEAWSRAAERAWFAGLDRAEKMRYLALKRDAIVYSLQAMRFG